MRRFFVIAALLTSLLLLAACGGAAAPQTVEVEVTRVVEGTTVTEVQVVTATPDPAAPVEGEGEETVASDTMVICMAQEPNTLLWSESALVTGAVLEAVVEPLIDGGGYGYQANLVEKLPSFDDGDATIEEVTLEEGDKFYDVATDAVMTLTAGMTETFSLNQLEGDPVVHEGWDGSTELTTVQITAQWTLVEGLTWEDGTPVTADDSVYGFEVLMDPNWTQPKYTGERTESYTALDERTVQRVLLPGFVDSTYYINVHDPKPRHIYGEMTVAELQEDEAANRDPVGYGAYLVDEWIAGESITLSANPAYAKGTPPLSTLIFRFVPDTNSLVAQLASGDCDIGTQDAAFEGSLPLIRGFEEQGLMEVVEVAGTVFEHLDFNTLPVEGYTGAAATLTDADGGLLFQNADFRRAIAHCIDRQAIVDQATNGAAFVQHTYTSADHPHYPGDDAVTIYDFNPETGLGLLEGLGWTDTDGDGILDKDGVKLSFVHGTRVNPLREKVTQIVQAQLKDNCMVETEIELIGSEFFADGPDGVVFGRKFDLAEFAWLTGVEAPCNLYRASDIPNDVNGWGASNDTGFANEEFDTACNAALQALDDEVKAENHATAMAIFTEELPSIPLFARAKVAVVRPGVEGVIMDPTINSELWNVENFSFVTE